MGRSADGSHVMALPKKTDAEKEATRRYSAQVEALTVRVYCARLEADSPGAALVMVKGPPT